MTISDAFNDVTDAMHALRDALQQGDLEEAQDAYDDMAAAMNALKQSLGLPLGYRPETS